MDKNQGYSILKAVMLENGRGFALGHHPTAPSPYVTWACYDDKNGQRQYEWGHYGNDLAAMEQDFSDRVKDYQRLYYVGIVQTEAPGLYKYYSNVIGKEEQWHEQKTEDCNRVSLPLIPSAAGGWAHTSGSPRRT